MRLKLTVLSTLFLLASCGTKTSPSNLTNDESTEHQGNGLPARVTFLTMSMSKWKDIVTIDSAVQKTSGGECVFTAPVTSDASTKWLPLQIYWTIFDPASEIRNGSALEHTFHPGEKYTSEGLSAPATGLMARGFSYLSPAGESALQLTFPKAFEPGMTKIQAVVSMAGKKSAIQVSASLRDGACVTATEACDGDESCFAGGSFTPTHNIRVQQNPYGIPTSLKFEPALGISRTHAN